MSSVAEAAAEETNLSPNPAFTPLSQACTPVASATPQAKPWFVAIEKPPVEARRAWEPAEKSAQGAKPADFRRVADIAAEAAPKQEPKGPSEETLIRERAQREAERIVAQAQCEAALIREEAHRQAFAEGREEGRRKGFAEGFESGYAQASAEARDYLTAEFERERGFYREDIEAFLAYIEAERRKAWDSIEPQIVQLAADAVRHIIKIETEENKTLVLATVQNAMRRVAESQSLRIKVNPADLETVRNYREEILEMLDGVKHLEINEDRRVGRGGCALETEAGNIDARIETQLQILPEIFGASPQEAN